MDEKEFLPLIKGIEEDVYTMIRKDLNKRLKDLPAYAIDNFKKGFWYDEVVPRQWNKLDEKEIFNMYSANKKQNLKAFDLFKHYKIIKNPLSCKIKLVTVHFSF